MKKISISPSSIRAIALFAFGLAATLAGITFYNMASIPTDENTFATAPSRVLLTRTLSGRLDGPPKVSSDVARTLTSTDLQSILPGDLLGWASNAFVRTVADLDRERERATADSIRVRVYRPRLNGYFTFMVRVDSLRRAPVTELAPSVVITAILPGGASDRAGMRVGDLISRINGVGFADQLGADVELRRAKSGAAIAYEGIRGLEPLVLHVTLARFGFPLSQLIFSLVGLAYMLFGMFLVYKRPDLVAARALGGKFLLLGFVIAVLLIRREPDPTLFVRARNILMVYALFFGTALGLHGSMVFPLNRMTATHRRWVLPLLYGSAVLSPLLLLLREEAYAWMLYIAIVVAAAIITLVHKAPLQPEQKKIIRAVRKSSIIVSLVVVLVTSGLVLAGLRGGLAFIGLLMLAFPLSYLFVITRYQLIDIDFRVRRNVQYTALSWVWGVLVAVLFIRVLLAIPGLPLEVPGVTFTGLSIEINPAPANPEDRVFLERLVMLLAGALMWFVLWYVRKWGQAFIDRKYYRTQFDYRRAAASLAEVLATRLSMNDIARGIVDAIVDLMRVRGAGLLVFRDGTECCCDAAAGVAPDGWHSLACGSGTAIAGALAGHASPVQAALLPPEAASILGRFGFQCVVPVRSHARLVGALLIGEKHAETSFDEEDLTFLSGVAKQVAVSIDNAFLYEEHAEKERMRHELAIARRIQLSSLPATTPDVPGLDIAGVSVPALEVGGDFFDYLGWNGKEMTLVVGDVSGKGTSAALYMSKVQGILRSLYGFDLPPREGFIRANRLLCSDLEKTSFVTALGARYRAAERSLTLVRAGHLPLYHYHAATGSVERVLPRGLGLGLNDAGVFSRELEDRNVGFATGDVMLFVTDGVTEARNAAGDEYGDDRVSAAIVSAAHHSAREIRDALAGDVRDFGAGMDQHDDQTIVVVKAV